jgi:hypothetical protein
MTCTMLPRASAPIATVCLWPLVAEGSCYRPTMVDDAAPLKAFTGLNEQNQGFVLETLRAVYLQMDQQVRTLLDSLRQTLGLAVAVVGIAAPLGAKHPLVLVMVPYVLVLLAAYQAQQFADMMVVAARRCTIQLRLDQLLNFSILPDDAKMGALRSNKPSSSLMSIVTAGIVIGSLVASVYTTFDHWAWGWGVADIAAGIVALTVLGVSFGEQMHVWGEAMTTLREIGWPVEKGPW